MGCIFFVIGMLALVTEVCDRQNVAKESSARIALGSIRAGITIFYANQAITTGTATWPTLDQLTADGVVMAKGIPMNLYQHWINASDSILDGTGIGRGTVIGERGG
ncbi:MAG: hypothetical protein V1685_04095, partial [Parcubacteria group bacterium]